MKRGTKIKTIVADSHYVYREGIKSALDGDEEISIIASTASGNELIELARKERPHVILTDVCLSGINTQEAIKQILQDLPGTSIITVTATLSEEVFSSMIQAGVIGYVFKDTDRATLLSAVKAAHAGKPFFCSQAAQMFELITQKGSEPQKEVHLSKKEKQIIELICRQHTSQEIADRLFLSKKTIDGYRVAIMEKLGCKNVIGVVAYAVKSGLVVL